MWGKSACERHGIPAQGSWRGLCQGLSDPHRSPRKEGIREPRDHEPGAQGLGLVPSQPSARQVWTEHPSTQFSSISTPCTPTMCSVPAAARGSPALAFPAGSCLLRPGLNDVRLQAGLHQIRASPANPPASSRPPKEGTCPAGGFLWAQMQGGRTQDRMARIPASPGCQGAPNPTTYRGQRLGQQVLP